MPVVQTDGRTVTWLPNFLGWVDYHISLAMGLRPRARFARGWSSAITPGVLGDKEHEVVLDIPLLESTKEWEWRFLDPFVPGAVGVVISLQFDASLACEQALLFGQAKRASRSRTCERGAEERRSGCQLGLLSVNFDFRNVIVSANGISLRLGEVPWMKICKGWLQALLSSVFLLAFSRHSFNSHK